uniref:Uncharacterized LOC100184483 n=1 Tax=Ciona intestinalis TaxID=7719 RepID=F7A8X4_CIOIN|nr:uncharacterized protein LOC100184483 [Ciona intestinalis]|eukprot:XP_002131426.1 uncharacterized protein LOC100184483 [Ciona intestinalis]
MKFKSPFLFLVVVMLVVQADAWFSSTSKTTNGTTRRRRFWGQLTSNLGSLVSSGIRFFGDEARLNELFNRQRKNLLTKGEKGELEELLKRIKGLKQEDIFELEQALDDLGTKVDFEKLLGDQLDETKLFN